MWSSLRGYSQNHPRVQLGAMTSDWSKVTSGLSAPQPFNLGLSSPSLALIPNFRVTYLCQGPGKQEAHRRSDNFNQGHSNISVCYARLALPVGGRLVSRWQAVRQICRAHPLAI